MIEVLQLQVEASSVFGALCIEFALSVSAIISLDTVDYNTLFGKVFELFSPIKIFYVLWIAGLVGRFIPNQNKRFARALSPVHLLPSVQRVLICFRGIATAASVLLVDEFDHGVLVIGQIKLLHEV